MAHKKRPANFKDLSYNEQIAIVQAELLEDPAVVKAIADTVASAPPPPADAIELLRGMGFPFSSEAA